MSLKKTQTPKFSFFLSQVPKSEREDVVQGGDITTPPALIEDEVTAPLDLSRSGPLDLSIQSTQEGHIGLAVQASNSPILTSAASSKPEVLVEQVESVEIIIQTDKIIILSPE